MFICSSNLFSLAFQSFDVTITTPPVIHNGFSSRNDVLGYLVKLNCNVTANPKANVRWYHNGKLVEYDWIVTYREPFLLIQSFEEKHKGIYQCVASNMMGEAQATGLLSLDQRSTPNDPPRNPKCFALNSTSIKVTFEGPEKNPDFRVCMIFETIFLIILPMFSYQCAFLITNNQLFFFFTVGSYNILFGEQT